MARAPSGRESRSESRCFGKPQPGAPWTLIRNERLDSIPRRHVTIHGAVMQPVAGGPIQTSAWRARQQPSLGRLRDARHARMPGRPGAVALLPALSEGSLTESTSSDVGARSGP